MREIKRGDIYFADLNPIRGSEQGGIRPVLVIQNDKGNKHSPTIIIAPVTSSLEKVKLPTHVEIFGEGLSKNSIVLLEQIRTIDKCRITDHIGRLDNKTMKHIDKAIETSLEVGKSEVSSNG